MKHRISVAPGLGLALTLAVVSAQAPAIKRTPLQQFDISAPGREAIMAKADIPPGGTTGKHTHPGEEISYILAGELVLEIEGQPARTLKAGEAFYIPAGKVHNGTNESAGNVSVLVTYVVEKGKPVTSPVK